MINLISCVSSNGAIGYQNNLLFNIKEDMEFFKRITLGNLVVMGRFTFESILAMNNNKPLGGRVNIVLTSDKNYKVPLGVFVYDSIETILKNHKSMTDSDKTVCVIGGTEVYRSFLEHGDNVNVYLTIVNKHVEQVDAYFPMDTLHEHFKAVEESVDYYSEEYDAYYKFVRYERHTVEEEGDENG